LGKIKIFHPQKHPISYGYVHYNQNDQSITTSITSAKTTRKFLDKAKLFD